MSEPLNDLSNQGPWNKVKFAGQKPPLKRKEIWATRVRLQLADRLRDFALFNLAIDSKLRGCDLVRLRVGDVAHGSRVGSRATIVQKKTGRLVQFEITGQTRDAIAAWIERARLRDDQFLFASRIRWSPHLSTRQYAPDREFLGYKHWTSPGRIRHPLPAPNKGDLDLSKDKNLRAVQLLLGHTKIESTIRYLGVEVDDVLEIAERTEV